MLKRYPLVGVGILGPRTDPYITKESNLEFAEMVRYYCAEKYGNENFFFVTVGTGQGFSQHLQSYCIFNKIKLVPVDIGLINFPVFKAGVHIQTISKEDRNRIYCARHAVVVDLCAEVFIKISETYSLLQDLIDRLKLIERPFWIYNGDNECLEYKGDVVRDGHKKEEKV